MKITNTPTLETVQRTGRVDGEDREAWWDAVRVEEDPSTATYDSTDPDQPPWWT